MQPGRGDPKLARCLLDEADRRCRWNGLFSRLKMWKFVGWWCSTKRKLNHIGGFCRWSVVEMFLLVGCSEDFLCFFRYIRSVQVIMDRFRLFIPFVPQGYRAIYSNGWYLDGLSSTWDHMYVTWQSFFLRGSKSRKTLLMNQGSNILFKIWIFVIHDTWHFKMSIEIMRNL